MSTENKECSCKTDHVQFANIVYDKLDEIVDLVAAIENNHKKRITSLEEEIVSLNTGLEKVSKVVEKNGISLAGLLEKNRFEFKTPSEKKHTQTKTPIKDNSTYYTIDLSYPQLLSKPSNSDKKQTSIENKLNSDIDLLIKKLINISKGY
jgi:hypothetical protein